MTALGPKSGPIITFTLPDPVNPGGQVERAWMGELTEATLAPDKGQTLLTSAYDGEDGEPWYLKGTAAQSAEAASLWRFTWAHSGEVVGYTFSPTGATVASADAPILSGYLTVGPKPALGGSASDEAFTFEFEWRCAEEPTLDVGEGGGD